MMSDFEIRTCADDAAWDSFVDGSRQGSPFARSEILNIFSANVVKVVATQRGEIVAAVPVFSSSDLVPSDRTPDFMLYQGVMFGARSTSADHKRITAEHRILTLLTDHLAAHFKTFGLCNAWSLEDLRAFQWHNYHEPALGQFQLRLNYTGIIENMAFPDFDTYLASVRTLRRREWKSAQKAGITIERGGPLSDFEDLHDKTYQRQDLTLPDTSRTVRTRLVKAAVDAGLGKLYRAVLPTGETASAFFILEGPRTAYYLFGANTPRSRGSGASSYLMLRIIEEYFSRGFKYFDFCGVNSPQRGDFKLSFNAALKPYYTITWQAP